MQEKEASVLVCLGLWIDGPTVAQHRHPVRRTNKASPCPNQKQKNEKKMGPNNTVTKSLPSKTPGTLENELMGRDLPHSLRAVTNPWDWDRSQPWGAEGSTQHQAQVAPPDLI